LQFLFIKHTFSLILRALRDCENLYFYILSFTSSELGVVLMCFWVWKGRWVFSRSYQRKTFRQHWQKGKKQ